MNIQHLVTGPMAVNTFIVYTGPDGEALVVDPGGSVEKIQEMVAASRLTVRAIFLTHGHADHIGGVQELRKVWKTPVWIHAGDAPMLGNPELNLSAMVGPRLELEPAERLLADGDAICLEDKLLTVRHTPGHTPGGVCLVGPNFVLTGDTLFAGSIGRTDLPGGNMEQLMEGIERYLMVLDDNFRVFPGHGPITFIGKERRQNPFLNPGSHSHDH